MLSTSTDGCYGAYGIGLWLSPYRRGAERPQAHPYPSRAAPTLPSA
jgi:hypothetical protein